MGITLEPYVTVDKIGGYVEMDSMFHLPVWYMNNNMKKTTSIFICTTQVDSQSLS